MLQGTYQAARYLARPSHNEVLFALQTVGNHPRRGPRNSNFPVRVVTNLIVRGYLLIPSGQPANLISPSVSLSLNKIDCPALHVPLHGHLLPRLYNRSRFGELAP